MIDLDSLDGIDIIDGSNEARTLEPEYNSPSQSILTSSMSHMDSNLLTCMLITANVGTIFEEVGMRQLCIEATLSRNALINFETIA